MRIDFQGRNADIEPRFVEHARPRLESLSHYSERLREVRLTLSVQRARYTVEITCDINGDVLRAEMRDNDALAAFDQTLAKVERQLERYKGKRVDRRKRGAGQRGAQTTAADAAVPTEPETIELEELEEFDIVRTKSHALKPMTPQEAVLQMEMVGHDFYVFLDGEAQRVGVVYRRRNGGYGLIEPETEEV